MKIKSITQEIAQGFIEVEVNEEQTYYIREQNNEIYGYLCTRTEIRKINEKEKEELKTFLKERESQIALMGLFTTGERETMNGGLIV